jgi:phosphatidylserine/phosphatidylglycerophosphate/cardiolipin synthase-like enzyme
MAKILTTKGSAAALEDLIRRAEKDLYLISFSFIISESFITRLKQAAEKGVIIHLVYGKSIKSDNNDVQNIENLKIYHFNNLHAKVFANETKCIIGSMNFSEASEINNTELGVLLSTQNDKEAFDDAMLHCQDIIKGAQIELDNTKRNYKIKSNNNKFDSNNFEPKFENNKTITKRSFNSTPLGYCIRTGQRISLNHERPFSTEAYREWAEWGNDNYAEQFCHFSGERSNGLITKANPILPKYWKEYQKTVSYL